MVALLALAVAVSGCALPLEEDGTLTSPPREFGRQPVPLQADEEPAPLPIASPAGMPGEADGQGPGTGASTSQDPGNLPDQGGAGDATEPPAPGEPPLSPQPSPRPSPEPSPETPSPSPPAPTSSPAADPTAAEPRYEVVGHVQDPRGDHGLEGPAYADIVEVTIEDDGVSARVTVDLAADLPERLADGEVMGIGVDLWRDTSRTESDYQLFADGGSDGWIAYLHTPAGFVDYPGAFRLGGRRIVFEVPWSSLGAMPGGGFRAFADWSQRRPVINAVSRDIAPDEGTAPFAR